MKTIILLLAMFAIAISASAQTKVKQTGNVLTTQSDSQHQHYYGSDSLTHTAVLTEYTFAVNDNVTLPVYQSKGGKYFVVRTSKKTGNEYRQYLKLD